MEEPEGTRSTPLGLVRWIAWAQRKGGDDWVRSRELTPEQAFVLGYLVQDPGAIQRDIADMTRTSAASVSSLLQGLERRGLVATTAGAELVAGFTEAMAEVDDAILAPLDADEQAQLLALLTKVTAQLAPPRR
jgi:MarR family transcriptional repressor of mepA